MTTVEAIQVVLLALLALQFPWAVLIERRVAKVHTLLSNGLPSQVEKIGKRVHNLEINCARRHPERTDS